MVHHPSNALGSASPVARPSLVLVNPWIYDFAAYDLWAKPLGLLHLAALLRQSGYRIRFLDCLDVHHPGLDALNGKRPARRPYGTGKFWRERTSRPAPLKEIRRSYSRYGIPTQLLREDLRKIQAPGAILVTSLMTYWYPGVQEVIRLCREVHPDAPVILGGTYARLCAEHALRFSGADHVVFGCGEDAARSVWGILQGYGVSPDFEEPLPTSPPAPALDLIPVLEYAPVLTSTGCPYRCPYCASHYLYPRFERRDPDEVWHEILFWSEERGVRDFVFYDDALLVDFDSHAALILERAAGKGLRFHTPNAIHVREIRPSVAGLLFRAGFRTIRLGLETVDRRLHHRMGNKVSEGEFSKAASSLRAAGFTKKDIGAYVLAGLPGQSVESVKETILFADECGVTPYLAEYTPMPHTPLWEEAVSSSAYDLRGEPLYHNNTLLPCWSGEERDRMRELRELLRSIRRKGL